MKQIVAILIGGVLIAVGALALWGAVELLNSGATTEAVAQGFLVPASLFVVGIFVIWMGVKGQR
ncbi:MAG: hypothetical protein P8X50_13450 [Maritimibacter sp.]|jgi:hypothetical protein